MLILTMINVLLMKQPLAVGIKPNLTNTWAQDTLIFGVLSDGFYQACFQRNRIDKPRRPSNRHTE
jgi:hypothetical protein